MRARKSLLSQAACWLSGWLEIGFVHQAYVKQFCEQTVCALMSLMSSEKHLYAGW